MSNEPNPPPLPPDNLQFDKAEFAQPNALSCSICKTPITGEYFQLNNQVSCPNCRQQLEAQLAKGNKASRTFMALAAGVAAAIGGFLIYWGIRAVSGYEFGLVAIVVGWMVGGAVRWGANHKGGLFYQFMAIALTYLSIASTYTPDIIEGMRESRREEAAAEATRISTNAVPNAAPQSPSASETPEEKAPFLVLAIIAFFLALAAPFLMGFENIIGILILGFGLYQAWSMNRKLKLEIAGPFNVSRPT